MRLISPLLKQGALRLCLVTGKRNISIQNLPFWVTHSERGPQDRRKGEDSLLELKEEELERLVACIRDRVDRIIQIETV